MPFVPPNPDCGPRTPGPDPDPEDVLNVSGHRLGTAEVESALVAHAAVSEAAVVGCPHDIKGQGVCCYVILVQGVDETPDLVAELRNQVRKQIGAIATPDLIIVTPGLPKTRSGKIMRRILRKIVAGEVRVVSRGKGRGAAYAPTPTPHLSMANWATSRPWLTLRWWTSWCHAWHGRRRCTPRRARRGSRSSDHDADRRAATVALLRLCNHPSRQRPGSHLRTRTQSRPHPWSNEHSAQLHRYMTRSPGVSAGAPGCHLLQRTERGKAHA